MIVEIFEPFSGWHHTKYIATLLPTLIRMKDAGFISRIVVVTSRCHVESVDFDDLLRPFERDVVFDVVDVDIRTIRGAAISGMLVESVARNRPGFLISTSANNGAFTLALRALAGRCFAHGPLHSVGIIHNGFSRPTRTLRETMRDLVHRFALRFAPWTEAHVVNPLLYRTIVARRPPARMRVRPLPDPVERRPALDRETARAMLGLPLDGRYLVQVGKTDRRKAVPELLAAFRTAALEPHDRLLIAGALHAPHRELIARDYADMLAAGRLIVIDRYLHPDELHAATCAGDVVAVAYHTDELSSNLLAALAADRPVLTNHGGYTGMIVETFDAGWSCEVADPVALRDAVVAAFAGAANRRRSAKTRRLLAYHDPQNFVDTVLARLYALTGMLPAPTKSWEWAVAATNESGNEERDARNALALKLIS